MASQKTIRIETNGDFFSDENLSKRISERSEKTREKLRMIEHNLKSTGIDIQFDSLMNGTEPGGSRYRIYSIKRPKLFLYLQKATKL